MPCWGNPARHPLSANESLAVPDTPIFDRVNGPAELALLADEMRRELIDMVSQTGIHLGPSLGEVELKLPCTS